VAQAQVDVGRSSVEDQVVSPTEVDWRRTFVHLVQQEVREKPCPSSRRAGTT
jgi:hypothetical protein